MIKSFHTVELSDPAYEREGLRVATVKSRALGRRADVTVWVPSAQKIDRLLILLHGVYGSHWAWSQKAGVHRTAQHMMDAGEIAPMVIAMPSDGLGRDGSGYLTQPHGEDAERWIVDEMPAIAQLAASALCTDAKIAIAGLSMGGYGALRLGAKYADRFSAISAHSAITDVMEMQSFTEEPVGEYLQCGPREELSAIYWLQKHRMKLPKLRFDCGVDDPLIERNRALHRALQIEAIAHIYEEFAGGHEWPYWQKHVAETLRFASE
ncbi:alpha/beta hydrolase-fold protein [Edaphobacter paludis]|uniref:Alpha/beta hydrolase-fold protein n=1 Tax=Edaphobacter paludis TaxID=3035702 RepID=A0AAU7DBV6_9BACT